MHLTDLNRTRDIGSSCLLVEIDNFKVIIDSGIHPKKVGPLTAPSFECLEPGSIDYIFLTHCHLDHVGSLPLLSKLQPQASILLSYPSYILASRLLYNSYHVMLRQQAELDIPEYPLFTKEDIQALELRLIIMPIQQPRVLSKKGSLLEVTFFAAGHTVGACGICLKNKTKTIFFSGDVLFENQKLLNGAKFPNISVDTLILETTRGNTQLVPNRTRASEVERLINTLRTTLDQGGDCLIPVFAFGRMQEIVMILYQAIIKDKVLPKVTIYASGLAIDLVGHFESIAQKVKSINFRQRMFFSLKIRPLPKRWSLEKYPSKGSIYLVSSGMISEHTPSYKVASEIIGDSKNAVMYVGYCDPETPGGKLLNMAHGDPFTFEVLDKVVPLNAQRYQFDLSSHANREELTSFAVNCNPRVIVLTHGDASARNWFTTNFSSVLPQTTIIDPNPGERLNI